MFSVCLLVEVGQECETTPCPTLPAQGQPGTSSHLLWAGHAGIRCAAGMACVC